jgi:glycosyltransferase involved in cell wall biosynthesis
MNEKSSRIAYLAARNSIHTVRLVNTLAQRGYSISLITLHDGGEALDERVQLFKLPIPAPWGYFLNVPFLKKLLKQLQPQLLHVHYASGYGTLGRLSQFQPLILSVWGSDIFDFPNQSFLHRALLVKNLRAATQICSTSQVMATATEAIVCSNSSSHQKIAITPFGIDTTLFYPRPELRDNKVLNIGTVKTLAPKYGIDTLIQAFYQLRCTLTESNPQLAAQLRLGIAGSGPQYADLQALVNQLELSAVTEFTGQLPHAKVPAYLNQLQIYVAASRLDSESFGVAILEASACGLPVVVSRVGGLPEVVEDGVSGYIVAKDNVEQLTEVLLKLVNNQTLRDNLGQAGRELVLTKYNWQDNVQLFENIYKKLSSG